jgi:hypothetical protein
MSRDAEKSTYPAVSSRARDNLEGYEVGNPSAAAKIAAMSPDEYREAEKRLVRKIDKNLIPWMT